MQSLWFLLVLPKSSWIAFTTIFETLSALAVCHVTSIGGVVYKKSKIFDVFGAYLSKLLIFLHEIFLIARSYQVFVINIKITLDTRLKVSILAVFWWFWAFFELSVLTQDSNLGHTLILFLKMYVLSRVVRDFFMISNSEPQAIQSKPDSCKSALWSGPFQFYLPERLETWSVARYWWHCITQ